MQVEVAVIIKDNEITVHLCADMNEQVLSLVRRACNTQSHVTNMHELIFIFKKLHTVYLTLYKPEL